MNNSQRSQEKTQETPRAGMLARVQARRRWVLFLVLMACALAVAVIVPARMGRPVGQPSSDEEELSAELPDSFPGPAFLPAATAEDLREEAMRVVDGLAAAYPDAADALNAKARLQLSLGNSAEALKTWQECAQRDPAFAAAYCGMGSVAKEKGEYENAADLLRKAVALAPHDTRSAVLLGEVLMKLGKMQEAVWELERALKQGTPTAGAVIALGQACLHLGQYDKASRAFEAAVQDAPGDKRAHYGLATAYARLGQEDKAEPHLEQFRKLTAAGREAYVTRMRTVGDPVSTRDIVVQAHNDAGHVYLNHGNAPQAELMWRKAAALDAKNVECRTELAALYERAGRDRDALRICRQLSDLDPRNADYWLNVGLLNGRLNRFDVARAAVQKAVGLKPQDPKYREAYKAIQQEEGRP